MSTFTTSPHIIREPEGETVSIAVAGDCCLTGGPLDEVLAGHSAAILAKIQPFLDDADLRIIQWEMALTNDDTPTLKSGPNLKCPPEAVAFATEGNFDVALLANNHIGDFGPDAVLESRRHLEDAGVMTAGVGADAETAAHPLRFDAGGFRIAVFNVAEHEFGIAGPTTAGAAPLDPLDNCQRIRDAATECDIVLMFVHGGNEHNPLPSPRMVKTYRAFADAGASAVINIHTHCPQGIEVHNGTPIIYSPGNFFFPHTTAFDLSNFWWTGYSPRLRFDRTGAVSFEVLPYSFYTEPYLIEPFTGEKYAAFMRYLENISTVLTDMSKVQDYFDTWCTFNGLNILSHICAGNVDCPTDYNDPEQVSTFIKQARNLFTCEAHDELLTNTIRMVEGYRVDEAMKRQPEVKALKRAYFHEIE